MKKNILVLCTGNSCRSQLAEGYLRLFHSEKALVYSAGVETHGVNPRSVAQLFRAMQNAFITISQTPPKQQAQRRKLWQHSEG